MLMRNWESWKAEHFLLTRRIYHEPRGRFWHTVKCFWHTVKCSYLSSNGNWKHEFRKRDREIVSHHITCDNAWYISFKEYFSRENLLYAYQRLLFSQCAITSLPDLSNFTRRQGNNTTCFDRIITDKPSHRKPLPPALYCWFLKRLCVRLLKKLNLQLSTKILFGDCIFQTAAHLYSRCVFSS